MVILGLLLIVAGVLAILAGMFAIDGTAELLGTDLHGTTIFLIGVGAGVAVLWGFTIIQASAPSARLERRRESKQLTELSEKLERVEAERRDDSDDDDRRRHPPSLTTAAHAGPARASATRSPAWPSQRGPCTSTVDRDVAARRPAHASRPAPLAAAIAPRPRRTRRRRRRPPARRRAPRGRPPPGPTGAP